MDGEHLIFCIVLLKNWRHQKVILRLADPYCIEMAFFCHFKFCQNRRKVIFWNQLVQVKTSDIKMSPLFCFVSSQTTKKELNYEEQEKGKLYMDVPYVCCVWTKNFRFVWFKSSLLKHPHKGFQEGPGTFILSAKNITSHKKNKIA